MLIPFILVSLMTVNELLVVREHLCVQNEIKSWKPASVPYGVTEYNSKSIGSLYRLSIL